MCKVRKCAHIALDLSIGNRQDLHEVTKRQDGVRVLFSAQF
jgi:hypothetical protein